MNPLLDLLNPYPFERLNDLLANVKPSEAHAPIALSLGEPKHAAPPFLVEAYRDPATVIKGFGTYPPTRGIPELRRAIAEFVGRRYQLTQGLDPETQVLPVNGTREALFAFAQAVIDPTRPGITLMPNPFYQIYEGAAILAGSKPAFVPCLVDNDFNPDFSTVPESIWRDCQLLYICSPGNPTGAIMGVDEMQWLIRKSDEFGFVIASDECYSEIYEDESSPPPGILQAASMMGRHDMKNCIAFNSLSKRSNLPGLRSGYVCGDAAIIEKFLLYRTYHGSAMPVHNQIVSAAAWSDEEHVMKNRAIYRRKFDAVMEILENVWPMQRPSGAFYLWPETPVDDCDFTRKLIETVNIKVVPGSYLSRDVNGTNPGANHVRMALVATLEECVSAAERLKQFMQESKYR
ncbi:MAG TPA: succinyldiaminopimelate transaminase [Pseudomonadales bacterium]|nr:succinyldiaminopimelate transaminase [Pseudomonadales bacterium]